MRLIGGVVAANLAAPFMFILFTWAEAALFEPHYFSEQSVCFAEQKSCFYRDLAFLDVVLLAALALILVTTFPASLLLALIGRYFDWRSPWIYMAGGVVAALGFAWIISASFNIQNEMRLPALSTLVGALCGWIYWRIALGPSPRNSASLSNTESQR